MPQIDKKLKLSYQTLQIDPGVSDEEITAAFKKLAKKYHPDLNRNSLDWAHEAMTALNDAYTYVMSYRFTHSDTVSSRGAENQHSNQKTQAKTADTESYPRDDLIARFIQLREIAKDHLYQYFQYSLYDVPLRDRLAYGKRFNDIVIRLRKIYHSIQKLISMTHDEEIREHCSVFNSMIYNFYRASECLTIIDSYSNKYDVEAYRLYKKGDDLLHEAQKEIFYERHNRGTFKSSDAFNLILQSEKMFLHTVKIFGKSSWAVETSIKLEYVSALKKYMVLFFTE